MSGIRGIGSSGHKEQTMVDPGDVSTQRRGLVRGIRLVSSAFAELRRDAVRTR
jgi:hypothetical protein